MMSVKDLRKSFGNKENRIEILKGLSFEISSGETVALLGKSGSGKSTLLSILAGLESPDTGDVFVGEKNLYQLSDKELTNFRAQNFGIIFQQFHLHSTLTAFENVLLPLEILKVEDAPLRAKSLIEEVGLIQRMDHLPSQLSGGESQRVALARAIATNPKILFADEPSGNLDEETGEKVMDLMFRLVQENNTTLVLVTHDLTLAKKCSRTIRLEHGGILQ